MTGVDHEVIEHNLNVIPGSVPIKQKKRGQECCRNKEINAKVVKLVDARIILEAIFATWIAYPMMVKKNRWVMTDVYRLFRPK